jgi:hypothetical protein
MKYPNLISTHISEKDLNEIIGAINFINEKLSDLVTISDLEKTTLYKAQTDTIEFVIENLKLGEKHPELIPDDVDIKEIRKDVEVIKSINNILRPLQSLLRKLEDSKLVAGSEAYLPSIAIYNAVKANAITKRRKIKISKVSV